MKIIRANNKTTLKITAQEIEQSVVPAQKTGKPMSDSVAKRIKQRLQFLDWQAKRRQDYALEDKIDSDRAKNNIERAKQTEQLMSQDNPLAEEPTFNTFQESFAAQADKDPTKAAALKAFKVLTPEQKQTLYHSIEFWDEKVLVSFATEFGGLDLQPEVVTPSLDDEIETPDIPLAQINMQKLIDWASYMSNLLEEENPTLADQVAREKAVRRHKIRHPSVS